MKEQLKLLKKEIFFSHLNIKLKNDEGLFKLCSNLNFLQIDQ